MSKNIISYLAIALGIIILATIMGFTWYLEDGHFGWNLFIGFNALGFTVFIATELSHYIFDYIERKSKIKEEEL